LLGGFTSPLSLLSLCFLTLRFLAQIAVRRTDAFPAWSLNPNRPDNLPQSHMNPLPQEPFSSFFRKQVVDDSTPVFGSCG